MGVKTWSGVGLPRIGSEVLIKLSPRRAPVTAKVTGHEVKWSAEARAFHVNVSVVDAAGITSQHSLQDVYPPDWQDAFHTGLAGRFKYVGG